MRKFKLLTLLFALVCATNMWAEDFDPYSTPLTFEIREDNDRIRIMNASWQGGPIYYSINGGERIAVTSAALTDYLPAGTIVQFWGDNDTYEGYSGHSYIVSDESKPIYVYGNIMSLISSTNFATLKELPREDAYGNETDQTFVRLFDWDYLSQMDIHPTKDLVLPATTLADECYDGLFQDCKSLTRAPVLPATTLAQGCYSYMFKNCIKLETAPVLPAEALTYDCYSGMFDGCTKLNRIICYAKEVYDPEHLGKTFADVCGGWVDEVAATGVFTAAAGATWEIDSEDGIPVGWTASWLYIVADNQDPTSVFDVVPETPISMSVKRTIYADGEYNTICLPFSLSASQIASSPLAGYTMLKSMRDAQVSGSGQDLSIDILVQDETEIVAGVPYLISFASGHGNIVDPIFEGVTVTVTSPSGTSAGGVTFQGMFAPEHITPYEENTTEDYLFLGENSQLVWPNNDGTSMRGFRGYFIIDRTQITPFMAPKGTRARLISVPKSPTAVDNVQENACSQKIMKNGMLYIIRGGKEYNAQGQVVK